MIKILTNRVVQAATAGVALPAVAVCVFAAVTLLGQSENRKPAMSPESQALVRQAIASTGLISVRNASDSSSQEPRPRGSAVVVRSDGVLVTNYHVINISKTSRVYDEIFVNLVGDGDTASSSARYRLKPVLIKKEYDLALLRVESDAAGNPLPKSFTFPSIEMADSRKIKVLEELFIIGFPEKGGSTITVNSGVVVEGKDILANWIKTDARVIHGNSGGAAVNGEGRLIGIPTKVVADEQPVDRDGDGFPDASRKFGAVGFLRPSHLVAEMIAQLSDGNPDNQPPPTAPKISESPNLITVRGIVRSTGGKPVAGALVGLLPLGESNITENTLLTWGSTNAEGAFKLNKPVPTGRYTLKAKALANQPYSSDVEIGPGTRALIIEMRGSPDR